MLSWFHIGSYCVRCLRGLDVVVVVVVVVVGVVVAVVVAGEFCSLPQSLMCKHAFALAFYSIATAHSAEPDNGLDVVCYML